MVTLIELDGSLASSRALQYAALLPTVARGRDQRSGVRGGAASSETSVVSEDPLALSGDPSLTPDPQTLTPTLLLLYVSPSGRTSDLAAGRLELERARRTCRVLTRDADIRTRLEVGKASEAIPAVARDEHVDLIVMGSHRVDSFPHVEALSRVARDTISGASCPVVVISPLGDELVDEGREMRDEKTQGRLSSPIPHPPSREQSEP